MSGHRWSQLPVQLDGRGAAISIDGRLWKKQKLEAARSLAIIIIFFLLNLPKIVGRKAVDRKWAGNKSQAADACLFIIGRIFVVSQPQDNKLIERLLRNLIHFAFVYQRPALTFLPKTWRPSMSVGMDVWATTSSASLTDNDCQE